MPSTDLIFQLSGTCNNYDWGKLGKESLSARLCEQTPGTGFKIEDDKFYSEMWFGDYPDFPGRVLSTGELLADHLQKHKQELLGEKVIKNLDGQLPYLPKILSISKALPLQIHPNKELATKLHKEKPDQFTDPNHKPEIAIALSEFHVFAGFKPLPEISPMFNVPALRVFVPDNTTTWTDETLREVTRNILLADDATVERAHEALAKIPSADLGNNSYIHGLLGRVKKQYGPQDPGNLVALLCMNFLVLQPGEALYVPADGIHAYLSGDIVECMARSNNVLNTGFCPRASRDNVDLFSDALTFEAHSKDDVYLPRKSTSRAKNGKSGVYSPPLSEFDIVETNLGPGEEEVLSKGDGPSVAIVTKGEGVLSGEGKQIDVKAGFIFFVAPGVEVNWSSKEGLQAFTTVV